MKRFLLIFTVAALGILHAAAQPGIQSVTAPADKTYKLGDNLDFVVTYNEDVDVNNFPRIAITLDTGGPGYAEYFSGTGTATLTFRYTVAATQIDANGIALVSPIDLNTTGTITRAGDALTDVGLTFTAPTTTGILIDAVAPTVSSVTSADDAGPHKVFDIITISVLFNEAVTVSGKPVLWLNVGTNSRYATYVSGSGTTTLTFKYTVATNDISADLDYTGTNALDLNGGTITDAAGNNATLTLAAPGSGIGSGADIAIDGVRPTVIDVTSTDLDATYILGDGPLTINVELSESITINTSAGANIPTLELEVGSVLTYATYTGGDAYTGTTLTFTYNIVAGNQTPDLDYKRSRSLMLNGATIVDAAGNLAEVTLPFPSTTGSLGANEAIVIDAVVPTVTRVSAATRNGEYKAGDEIVLTVTFSEPVAVNGGLTAPTLIVNTGATTTSQTAVYDADQSSATTLAFVYTVVADDESLDLDYVGTGSLVDGDGAIADLAGNVATVTLATPGDPGSLSASKSIIIDTAVPVITGITTTATDAATYLLGDNIDINVVFDEPVFVSGRPRLKLNSGGYAIYYSGRGTNTLIFKYTVGEGDTSADLNITDANALELYASSSIKDKAGNDPSSVVSGLTVLVITGGIDLVTASDPNPVSVDGIVPNILNVFADTDGTYMTGGTITIKVQFSADVAVNNGGGNPTIALNSHRTTAIATYASVATNVVSFTYTVAAGDESLLLDYQRTRSLVLNGGTIKSTSGNDVDLTLPSPGTTGSLSDGNTIIVDGVAPVVERVSSTASNGSYREGDVIGITATFSEEVSVTAGTPTISLNSGGTATYSEGTGTKVLTFLYTVGAADASTDLDYVDASSITLGTITDLAGNEATYTLPAYTGDPGSEIGTLALRKNIVIDNTDPAIQSISTDAATGTYIIGEKVEIDVVFGEPVYVSGRPRLKLNAGTDAYAYYRRGRGTTTLTFEYTVEQGHTTSGSDISFADANSLELYGGSTITDKAGNDPSSVVGDLTVVAIPGGITEITVTNTQLDIDGVAPVVVNVFSDETDQAYNAGEVLVIKVEFDEPIAVDETGGTPRLALNALRTGAYASFTALSGVDEEVAEFTYTVQAGDNSADLDYLRTRSLELNGGTIKKRDGGQNDAVLTLPYPTTAGSLGANNDIVIDTESPTVVRVASSSSNRTYGIGEKIYITVTFSEEVLASGATSTLTLNSGGSASLVDPGVNPTTTLVYEYTVVATNQASDLDYTATNALALSAGTILDAAGNSATLTLAIPGERNSLGRNASIVVDGVAPTVTAVSSPSPGGSYAPGSDVYIWVEFTEPVLVLGKPSVTLETGSATYLSGTGTNRIIFKYTVQDGDGTTTDLDYTNIQLNGGSIKDFASNAATGLDTESGTLAGIDINAPAKKSTEGNNQNNGNSRISRSFDFTVYPNPSNGIINLSMKDIEEEVYSIEVMDAIGRVVYQEQADNLQPQITLDVKPGIYMVKVKVGKQTQTKRFIVQ